MAGTTEQLFSMKAKNGDVYYAHLNELGFIQAVRDRELANVARLSDHPHPKSKRIVQFIAVGGIITPTYKTIEERKANRESKRAKRKAHDKAIVDKTTKKLLEHPPREFTAKFLEKQKKRVEASAGKNAKRKAKIELKIQELQNKAKKL